MTTAPTCSTCRNSTSPREAQRGSAGAEFALIVPLILSLFFGIVTAGTAYTQKIAVVDAAHDASRYGATRPVDGDIVTWLTKTQDQAIMSATGSLSPTEDTYVCVAFVHPNGTRSGDTTKRVERYTGSRLISQPATQVPTASPCYTDGLGPDERRVQVLIKLDTEIETIVASHELTITAKSTSRYERAVL